MSDDMMLKSLKAINEEIEKLQNFRDALKRKIYNSEWISSHPIIAHLGLPVEVAKICFDYTSTNWCVTHKLFNHINRCTNCLLEKEESYEWRSYGQIKVNIKGYNTNAQFLHEEDKFIVNELTKCMDGDYTEYFMENCIRSADLKNVDNSVGSSCIFYPENCLVRFYINLNNMNYTYQLSIP